MDGRTNDGVFIPVSHNKIKSKDACARGWFIVDGARLSASGLALHKALCSLAWLREQVRHQIRVLIMPAAQVRLILES